MMPLGPGTARCRRYRKASLIWYHVLDGSDPEEGIGIGFDISQSGLGIRTPGSINVGARVLVHLRCREFDLTAVTSVTRVRASGTGQFEVGLKILVLPPDHRSLITRIFP